MVELVLIAAVASNGVIGAKGKLPWNDVRDITYPDLQRFKEITYGHPIIMGRKTFESLPKKPLPYRTNIVVTRNKGFTFPNVIVAYTVEEALQHATSAGKDVFCIGGEELYTTLLPKANRLELTEITGTYEGDAHFPSFNRDEWTRNPRRTLNLFSFVSYTRNSPVVLT